MDVTQKWNCWGVRQSQKALVRAGPSNHGWYAPVINALYNLVDTYFVGGLGTNQMGAITVAFPLGQIVVGLGLLFGNGAAACLSRLLGCGDRDSADKVASTAVYSSISIGAIVICCSMIFLKPILKQIGAVEDVMPYAMTYSGIYITFSIFNVFNVTMNNIVSSEGAANSYVRIDGRRSSPECGIRPCIHLCWILGLPGQPLLQLHISGNSFHIGLCALSSGRKSVFSFSVKA